MWSSPAPAATPPAQRSPPRVRESFHIGIPCSCNCSRRRRPKRPLRFAWSITVLLVLRLVQGLAGAAGIVIARAVARDLYEGRRLVVFFSRLVLISGLAPVIAPVLGGQLNRVMTWRGIFGVLAGDRCGPGAGRLVGSEGEPAARAAGRRRSGGHPARVRACWSGTGSSSGVALAGGLAGASMFAYIAGGTFVLQRIYGLSPQGFSLALRRQLGRDHGGRPAERAADPTAVAGAGPGHRAGA